MRRALLAVMLLSACSLGTPVDTGRGNMWALEAADAEYKARYGALVVNLPNAAAQLDTYRVSVRSTSGARDYYAGTRWVDFLPATMQSVLVQTLERSGLFAAVYADTVDNDATLMLDMELSEFTADYRRATAPVIEVAMTVTLSNRRTNGVMRQFTIHSSKPARADDSEAVRGAFQAAFADAQSQMLERLAGR